MGRGPHRWPTSCSPRQSGRERGSRCWPSGPGSSSTRRWRAASWAAATTDLGNHTLHHLDIAAIDGSGAYAETAGCALRLRALTGSIGRWFRPSKTRYATALIEQAARKAGYRTCVSYDVDSLDYTDPGPDAVVATVLGSVRPGSIISLHLGHPGTVTALPAIVHGLARRGLRPVTLTGLLSP